MFANIAGGLLTYGVHFLAKAPSVSAGEYAAFGTLLMAVACLPTLPLQMIFAQQTAKALATGKERQLTALLRVTWLWTFLVWTVGAVVVWFFHERIVTGWHLPNVTPLLVTLPLFLLSLWTPIFGGVLQGRQDFFSLGWSSLLNGFGRVAVSALLVLALALGAAGMMTGMLIGVALATGICIWRTRDLWSGPAEKFASGKIFRQALPLFFGFGAFQFMFTSDTMFAKAHFSDDQMAPYVVVGTLSRAMLWLVLPLAAVMFPKLVHASAKGQKTNLFNYVVLGTAVLAAGGALGLWLTGPLLVKIVSKPEYVAEAVKLLPWYAGAMVPLAIANVMVNDLMARERYGVVPFMVALVVAYGFTLPWMLNHFPGRIEVVLQTLAAFNFLLFAICGWFIWGPKTPARS